MGRQRPSAVSNAIRVQWALVAASGVLALLTVVMREDLLSDWAESRGGLEFVRESQLSIPSFCRWRWCRSSSTPRWRGCSS